MTTTILNTKVHSNRKEGPAPVHFAIIFLISLIVPILLRAGPIVLFPHRLVLLLLFIPCLIRLLSGRAGPIILADYLMLGSAIWACLAYIVNHGLVEKFEAIGIHMIEFFGAYLLARVAIRSSEDFRKFAVWLFWIMFALLPFAAIEAISKRAILLEMIPHSISIVHAPYRLGMRRAQVLFTHPIHYGIFASMGMALFWYCLRPAWTRIVSIPTVVASTVFSLSSGALICVVLQTIVIFWEVVTRSIKHRWRIFAVLFAIFYVVVEAGSNSSFFEVVVRYASFSTDSAYNRILIWQYGTQNVAENPFFGIADHEWKRAAWMSTSADNFWLLITMQFGLPCFIMFAWAVLYNMFKAGRAKLSDPMDQAARVAYLTVCVGIIIGGGTVHYWTAMMALVLFMFGAGAWSFTGGGMPAEGARTDSQSQDEIQEGRRYSRFASRPLSTGSTAPTAYVRASSGKPKLQRQN